MTRRIHKRSNDGRAVCVIVVPMCRLAVRRGGNLSMPAAYVACYIRA